MSVITVADLNARLLEVTQEIDECFRELPKVTEKAASAERDYRRERARAWLEAKAYGDSKFAKELEDEVKDRSADARWERDVARSELKTLRDRIDTLNQRLSSWQTLANGIREEMRFAGRYEVNGEGAVTQGPPDSPAAPIDDEEAGSEEPREDQAESSSSAPAPVAVGPLNVTPIPPDEMPKGSAVSPTAAQWKAVDRIADGMGLVSGGVRKAYEVRYRGLKYDDANKDLLADFIRWLQRQEVKA